MIRVPIDILLPAVLAGCMAGSVTGTLIISALNRTTRFHRHPPQTAGGRHRSQ